MYVEKHLELGFRNPTSAVWAGLSRSCYPAVFRNAFRESPFFAHGLLSNVLARIRPNYSGEPDVSIADDAPTPGRKVGYVRS
jgi:hypothetical protein